VAAFLFDSHTIATELFQNSAVGNFAAESHRRAKLKVTRTWLMIGRPSNRAGSYFHVWRASVAALARRGEPETTFMSVTLPVSSTTASMTTRPSTCAVRAMAGYSGWLDDTNLAGCSPLIVPEAGRASPAAEILAGGNDGTRSPCRTWPAAISPGGVGDGTENSGKPFAASNGFVCIASLNGGAGAE